MPKRGKKYQEAVKKVEETGVIKHVAEAATQLLLLQSGDVDMAKNLTPDQIAGLDTKTVKVESYPQAAVHFLSFNQKDPDLTNPKFWEAAHYLVDYKGMTDSFLKGQMTVHQAFWPSGFPGALDATPYTYDPAKAIKILADAGIKTPIKVTLDVINSSSGRTGSGARGAPLPAPAAGIGACADALRTPD